MLSLTFRSLVRLTEHSKAFVSTRLATVSLTWVFRALGLFSYNDPWVVVLVAAVCGQ